MRHLEKFLAVFALSAYSLYLWTALRRMGYAYELDWMEGGMLQIVHRIASGDPIYVAPSLEYVPLIYTPLFFQFAQIISTTVGENFLALRLTAFISSAACFAGISWNVFLRTQSKIWAFIAGGMFAACYDLGGSWFDLGRVDMLFLALLLWGVTWLEFKPSLAGQAAGSALLILAFMAKQSMLLAAAPLILVCVFFFRGPKRWVFPVTWLAAVAVYWLLMHRQTDGWFTYYIYTAPKSHEVIWTTLYTFWNFDLLTQAPALLLSWLLTLYATLKFPDKSLTVWIWALSAAFLGVALSSRMHTGAFANVLLPAYAWMCICFGWVAHALAHKPGFPGIPRSPRVVASVFTVILALQIYKMAYDPRPKIPSAEDLRAVQAFDRRIGELSEETIWMPWMGWLTAKHGGIWAAHKTAIWDVLRGPDPQAADLARKIEETLASGRWSLVIVNDDYFDQWITKYCTPQPGPLLGEGFEFYPRNYKTRPTTAYVPQDNPSR